MTKEWLIISAIIALILLIVYTIYRFIDLGKELNVWSEVRNTCGNWSEYDQPTYQRKPRQNNSQTPLHGRLVLKQCQDKVDTKSPFH